MADLAQSSVRLAPGEELRSRAASERDPIAAALALVGGSMEAQSVRVESARRSAEGPGPVTVVVVRDGLLDDSVRADWHRVTLSAVSGSVGWRVTELRRAVRCRRGRGTVRYSDQRCD